MTIITGDCIEAMAAMEAESIDAICTDPPYGLEFMGKAWDRLVPKQGRAALKTRDGFTAYKSEFKQGVGTNIGAPKKNPRCRKCGKLQFDHPKGKCKCESPDWNTRQSEYAFLNQVWHQQWAEAAYRVAKPSAYLLAFGGTRTVHRLTSAIEDAGWIIRDMLVWAYASGFPKSKASLKPAWEPIVMARKPGPLRELAIDACRIPTDDALALHGRSETDNGWDPRWSKAQTPGQTEGQALGRWPANVLLTADEEGRAIFDGGWDGVVGGGDAAPGGNINGRPVTGYGAHWADSREFDGYGDSGTYSRFFSIPTGRTSTLSGTMGACQTCGAPVAGLPSTARTRPPDTAPPSAATPPSEFREPHVWSAASPSLSPETVSVPSLAPTEASSDSATTTDSPTTSVTETPSLLVGNAPTSRTRRSRGSKPAELSLTPDPASPADQSETSSGTTTTTPSPLWCDSCVEDAMRSSMDERESGERNYPWAFLVPKADRADREPVLGGLPEQELRTMGDGAGEWTRHAPGAIRRQNVHPTVKPTELMRHLVRLVTPTGGVVLDPFLGSGSTALAAEMEGFPWIGIEKEREYCDIAEARLNGTQRGLGLDVPAPVQPRKKMPPHVGPGETWVKGWAKRYAGPPAEERPAVDGVDLELFPRVAGPAEGDEGLPA